jgi:hypothetical protein
MSDFVIVTQPGDVHAHAVRWALTKLGYPCKRWVPELMASRPVSISFSGSDLVSRVDGPDGEIQFDTAESIWLRRFSLPLAPESLTLGDRIVADRESASLVRGVLHSFESRARWVNTPGSQRNAGLKATQLALAQSVGLSIPKTVLTNDLAVARAFVASLAGRAIYKGFNPAIWQVDTLPKYSLYTSVVTREDLEGPDGLRHAPGIFQEFIEKDFELRVTIFGRSCIAAKITEQDGVDWRLNYGMKLAPYELPGVVRDKLLRFMDRMGLVMGCIDLVVTPDGEHVFLEVNEQGQFLWVEEKNPDIRLLAPFASFLAQRDAAAEPVTALIEQSEITMAEYLRTSEYQAFVAAECAEIPRNSFEVPEPSEPHIS